MNKYKLIVLILVQAFYYLPAQEFYWGGDQNTLIKVDSTNLIIGTKLQEGDKKLIEIDIAIEPNLSWLVINDKSLDIHSGIGINLRVPLSYSVIKVLSIDTRPGISYYTQGISYESGILGSGTIDSWEYKLKLYNLSAPLYLKIIPQKEFAFYIGTDLEYTLFKDIVGDESQETFLTQINNNFFIGLSGGLTYSFKGKLKFQFFYTKGLNSLINDLTKIDENGNPTEELKIQRNYFSLGISYKLVLS